MFSAKRKVGLLLTGSLLLSLACPLNAAFAAAYPPLVQSVLAQLDAGNKLTDSQVEQLLDASKKAPKDPAIKYALGRYYESVNFGTLACDQYWSAFILDQTNSEPLITMARLKIRMGDVDAFNQLVAKAFERFPNDYKVLVTAGLQYQRMNDLKNAHACYEKAMKLKPSGDAELLSAISQLFFKQSKFHPAIVAAERAIAIDPNSFSALTTKGECLALAGAYDRAFDPLSKAFHNGPLSLELASYYYQTAMQCRRYDEALEPLLIVMASKVGEERALLHYKHRVANVLAVLPDDKIAAAAKSANDRLKGTKWNALLYFCMGDIYDRVKKPQKAVVYYQEGLKSDPNYARAYLRLGEDQEQFGQYKLAMDNYDHAYTLLPDDSEIAARHDRLKQRMTNRQNDLAWRLKQALTGKKS